MKKALTLIAVLFLAGCGEKKTVAPAADSTAMMQHDSGMIMGDSGTMMHDSTMARDTAKKI